MHALPLHLPLDFEMREDVRRLVQKLKPTAGDGARQLAAVYFIRLWCDWGRCGVRWRALDQPFQGVAHAWAEEPIAHILQDVCDWKGQAGDLMKLVMEAGIVQAIQDGDLWGLVLNDFWLLNAHFAPDFKTTQQKGGMAKAEKRRQLAAEEMATQQRTILERQGALSFSEEQKTSPEEQKKAIALIVRMDRACGQPVRSSSQYSAALLGMALLIIRTYKPDHITLVERYLVKHRDNHEVVKIPDRVIAGFDELFKRIE